MKAHGIHQSQTQSTIRDTPVPSVPRRKASPGGTPLAKKRKHDQFVDSDANGTMDDDENMPSTVKTEGSKRIKAESSKDGVKTEPVPNFFKIEDPAPAFKTEASAVGVKEEPLQGGEIKIEPGKGEGGNDAEVSFASTGLGGFDEADDDVIFDNFLTPHPFSEPVSQPLPAPFAPEETVDAKSKSIPESIFIED